MKVFISKYAITQGIFEITAEVCNSTPDMVKQVDSKYPTYYHKGQWHLTREEAVAKAEVLRKRKLASIDKQRARITALKF